MAGPGQDSLQGQVLSGAATGAGGGGHSGGNPPPTQAGLGWEEPRKGLEQPEGPGETERQGERVCPPLSRWRRTRSLSPHLWLQESREWNQRGGQMVGFRNWEPGREEWEQQTHAHPVRLPGTLSSSQRTPD